MGEKTITNTADRPYLDYLEVPLIRALLALPWDSNHFEFALHYLAGSGVAHQQSLYFGPLHLAGDMEYWQGADLWWTRVDPALKANLLQEVKQRLANKISFIITPPEVEAFAAAFRKFFDLSELQLAAFLLFALPKVTSVWEELQDRLENGYQLFVAKLLHLDLATLHTEAFSNESQLQQTGLLETNTSRRTRGGSVGVLKEALEVFQFRSLKTLGTARTEALQPCDLPLTEFTPTDLQRDLLLSLLGRERDSCILLYGTPGTGKTTLTSAVASQLGVLARNYIRQGEWHDELGNILLAARFVAAHGGFLVIDEADDLLGTESGYFRSSLDKGTVNRFLDHVKGRVVFITNKVDRMDPSTARRFDLVIRFDEPSETRLLGLWEKEIAKQGLAGTWTEGEVRRLARQFKTNLGVVSQAAELLHALPNDLTARYRPQQIVEAVLESQRSLVSEKPGEPETLDVQFFDPGVLNTSTPAADLVRAAHRWQSLPDRTYGLKYLFYGITGGGKSQLARHIARELSMPLLVRQASDLLGMYVGQTEAQIRSAFEEALRSNAVLVIDEVDSFLQGRTGNRHSWENTMVNEFLTNIETYRGLMIVSTNLPLVLDVALLRRFTMKVEFKHLTLAASRVMLERYFPEAAVADAKGHRLAGLTQLTPGDFGAVKARQVLFPEIDVFDALHQEAQMRGQLMRQGNPIGFVPKSDRLTVF